jgi:hypothetical protein
MAKYRIVFISSRGQPFGFRDLDAYDDTDAIKWARRTFTDVEMEIRRNDRTIAKFKDEAEQIAAA